MKKKITIKNVHTNYEWLHDCRLPQRLNSTFFALEANNAISLNFRVFLDFSPAYKSDIFKHINLEYVGKNNFVTTFLYYCCMIYRKHISWAIFSELVDLCKHKIFQMQVIIRELTMSRSFSVSKKERCLTNTCSCSNISKYASFRKIYEIWKYGKMNTTKNLYKTVVSPSMAF